MPIYKPVMPGYTPFFPYYACCICYCVLEYWMMPVDELTLQYEDICKNCDLFDNNAWWYIVGADISSKYWKP